MYNHTAVEKTPPPTTTHKKEGGGARACVCFGSGVHKDVELLRLGDRADGGGGDLSSPCKSTTYWSVWLTDRQTDHCSTHDTAKQFKLLHCSCRASNTVCLHCKISGFAHGRRARRRGWGGNENIKAILKNSECEKRWFLKQPLCRAT